MRTASRLHAACVGALVSLAPLAALAAPPRTRAAPGRLAATTPPGRTARRPPGPPIALQLTGLRLGAAIAVPAMMHAIARDAWPRLSRCTAPLARRGYTNVELRQTGPRRALEVVVRNGPGARDAALTQCIQHALSTLAVPPYEGPTPEVTASFDLLFNLPSVTATPRRR